MANEPEAAPSLPYPGTSWIPFQIPRYLAPGWSGVDPTFDPLRKLPRKLLRRDPPFQNLVRRP
jgi:hypothetical protein